MPKAAATAAGRRNKRLANPPIRGTRMVSAAFEKLCSESQSPVAIKAFHLFKQGDFAGLLALPFEPFFYEWNSYDTRFALDYQIVSFFKKHQDLPIKVDKEKPAFDKWLRAEESCRQVNQLFRSRWEGRSPPLSFPVEEVLHLARRKITEVLSTVKPADLDTIRDRSRHGPGGDTALVRRNATSYEKYRSLGEITPRCNALYDEIFGCEPDVRQDFAHLGRMTDSSKLSFVPKTALIDRAICIEPRWNVYLQLGIGALLERRLRRLGIDLKDQSRNQRLACAAYSSGYATVDLSSASDTVARNLVADLLRYCDPYWLELLEGSRCSWTTYKGTRYYLQKISSMGNGYTFPLETLIFYAFAWAVCKFSRLPVANVSVYGDDIIVPRGAYSLLVEVLETFGFAVNTAKSYASGNFFESCGCDYYKGRNVRPFFVKKNVGTLLESMAFYNQVVAWAELDSKGRYSASRLSIADVALKEIPASMRYFGPTTISGVFHSGFERWGAQRNRDWLEGYTIRAITASQQYDRKYSYRGHLYSKLAADLDSGNRVAIPGSVKFRVSTISVPSIPDFIVDDWY